MCFMMQTEVMDNEVSKINKKHHMSTHLRTETF